MTAKPPNERNLVRCQNPTCRAILGADVAGLSVVRTEGREWVGIMIRIRCRCGFVLAADAEVLSKILVVLAELFPRFTDEQRAALGPVEPLVEDQTLVVPAAA